MALESLESRQMLTAIPLISEFMADNENALLDGDGITSDWIELTNAGDAMINLAGWYLTDDAGNLNKWPLPDLDIVELDPGEELLLFASNQTVDDYVDPSGYLHTNFQLSPSGEFLALVQPDGVTVAHQFASQFPQQFPDVSYGIDATVSEMQLVEETTPARFQVPTDGSLGTDWITPDFDDTSWTQTTSSVGFDDGGDPIDFTAHFASDVGAAMQGNNATSYLRIPFEAHDLDQVDQLFLDVKYDDGFVAYINGDEVAQRNSPSASASPDTGLLSYWSFDETLIDQASEFTNNRGVGQDDFAVQSGGAARFVPGIAGQAIALDEIVGDALSLNSRNSADAQLGAAYTIESWIYPTALNGWGRFALNWTSPGTSYHFALRNGSQVSLFHNQAGGTNVNIDSAAGTVGLGADIGWQHIAGVADGSLLRIYHNGVLVGSTPYDGTINEGLESIGLGDIKAGGSAATLRYQGYVDELAIWNVALTDEQLRAHFDAGADGYGLTRPSEATEVTWNSTATSPRPNEEAIVAERIDLTSFIDSLQEGGNVLAIQGLNLDATDADFLLNVQLTATTLNVDPNVERYFVVPTPGAANGQSDADQGPVISFLSAIDVQPGDDDDLQVASVVSPAFAGSLADVTLHYRVMFGDEIQLAMFDDGLHGDGAANDGVYAATIPAAASVPRDMVRWRVTASDAVGNTTAWPLRPATIDSPEYLGTVVADPTVDSELARLQWFVEDAPAAESRTGTRASVYYLGEFYDNVFVRQRGQTSANWPKKSYKFEFNEGYHLRFVAGEPRVDEINVNTTFTDKSYVRSVLAFETFRESGVAAPLAFPLRVEQNREFYSVAILTEQVDRDFLRRNDLDDQGALYKGVANGLQNTATTGFEKDLPRDNDFSDLQAFATGLQLTGDELKRFLFDNVDLPAQINYMAANVVIQNIDRTVKNYYLYRDTEGDRLWRMLPWDVDLSFGPDALNTDVIDANDDTPPDRVSHPFMGTEQFPFNNLWNGLLDAIIAVPETREMFLRRLRTLSDQFLGGSYYEDRIDTLVAQLGPDVLLDKARWGADAHFGNIDYTLIEATERIKNEYLGPRRTHLFETHNQPVSPPQANLAIDATGSGHNGTLTGTANFDPTGGLVDGAASFDGSAGSVIDAGNDSALNPLDEITVALWVNLSVDKAGEWHILAADFDGDPSSNPYHFAIDPAQKLNLFLDPPGDPGVSKFVEDPNVLLAADGWTHVAFTVTASPDGVIPGEIKLYRNGVQVSGAGVAGPFTGEFAYDTLPQSIDPFQFGNKASMPASTALNGLLDEAAIWSAALTDQQIASLASGASPETIADGSIEGYWRFDEPAIDSSPSVGIPDMQPLAPALEIGAIDFSPASLNQEQEFIELVNPNDFAVDISGWQLAEAVDFTFAPATVITAGGSLFVSPSVVEFRARTESPTGGEGRFVQGNYRGHLSSFGETIRLLDEAGTEIASHTYDGNPSAAQQFLRITEINYHPADPTPEEIAAGFADDDLFEFIELQNVGTEALNLQDVHFLDGIGFTYDAVTLDPGQFIVVVHDLAAFEARYGTDGITIAGTWDATISGGDLKNSGEQIELSDQVGATIHEFTYNDKGGWPLAADGLGGTLNVIDTSGDYDDPNNWRASYYVGGTPGHDGAPTSFVVESVVPQGREVEIQFLRDLEPAQLNLYDGPDAPVDAADVSLVGEGIGPVAGSLVWEPAAKRLVFVATMGSLPADRYTLTLFSRADGLIDSAGEMLDGDADRSPGGNFESTFTIEPTVARRLSVADFARGPNQAIELQDTTGVPIRLSDTTDVLRTSFTVRFDPLLLDVTAAVLASDIPADWRVERFEMIAPGEIFVEVLGTTAISGIDRTILSLTANTPTDAPIGSAQLIRLESVAINEGEIATTVEPGLHVVAYLGDTTGQNGYSGLDASQIARVAVGLDSGFDAFSHIDPMLVGDVTGNGAISALDASFVARKAVDLDQPEIPDLPLPLPVASMDFIEADLFGAMDISPFLAPSWEDESPRAKGVESDSEAAFDLILSDMAILQELQWRRPTTSSDPRGFAFEPVDSESPSEANEEGSLFTSLALEWLRYQ